jgi:hypothetical protein
MSNEIDIKGIDKAELLAALFNGSHQMGMGMLHLEGAKPMTAEEARKYVSTPENPDAGDDHVRMFGEIGRIGRPPESLYFDYLLGRPLKSEIGGDTFKPWGYDRDNGGDGAAEAIINRLRRKQEA